MDKLENQIIDTGEGLKNGQKVCRNCGSTQMHYDPKIGKLICPICESRFEGEMYTQSETRLLNKNIIGSGAKNINEEFDKLVTIKCNGCGAEIVFDTSKIIQQKCHWCGGILSINERIENGTVPDVILPFIVTKEQAKEEIEKYIKNKKFAHKTFKKNIKLENIAGVYLPYMLIDANTRCHFEGAAEREKNTIVNTYKIKRIFDLQIEDLTIETSKDKIRKSRKYTNNIINSIMPFDIKNCIKFESSYLTNFRTEKRDINIDELRPKVEAEIKDIARHKLRGTTIDYNRGIRWRNQKVEIKGIRWMSAYLPVWIYSYHTKRKTYYVAVNGRTKETAGSIPLNYVGLIAKAGVLEIIALILSVMLLSKSIDENSIIISTILMILPIRKIVEIYKKYKNKEARHKYEKDTKTVLTMRIKDDEHLDRTQMKDYEIKGRNDIDLDAENIEIEHNQKLK